MDAVALRKESVDRNNTPTAWYRASDTSLSARRAWIEIRVGYKFADLVTSLSARRAWIEISGCKLDAVVCKVALRKESVDRNTDAISDYLRANRSLSARRAWIEIC